MKFGRYFQGLCNTRGKQIFVSLEFDYSLILNYFIQCGKPASGQPNSSQTNLGKSGRDSAPLATTNKQ